MSYSPRALPELTLFSLNTNSKEEKHFNNCLKRSKRVGLEILAVGGVVWKHHSSNLQNHQGGCQGFMSKLHLAHSLPEKLRLDMLCWP